MGNVGGGEIIVILLVALLILGPNKLPEAARQIGRAMGELRKVTSGFQRELQDALKDSDEVEARRRGEAIAATRPIAATVPPTDNGAPSAPSMNGTPSGSGAGSEPVPVDSVIIDAVTVEQAASQIPPAPAGDATDLASGSDR
jgi:Tat protein translocase TatB subunit